MLDKKTFKRSKMVSANYGLNILGKGDLVLKDEQWEIIRYITLEKEMLWLFCRLDAANHCIPPIIDFMEKSSSTTAAIVLVFSPLNALIRELRESGMKACILKGDRVALDVEDAEEEIVHVSLSTCGTIRKPERLSFNILSPRGCG